MNNVKFFVIACFIAFLSLASGEANAIKLCNNAWMNTTTTGTGNVTVTTAKDGAQTFEACGIVDNDTFHYHMDDEGDTDWEIGTATYDADTDTFTRAVIESSNSDTPISLSGTGSVSIIDIAQDVLHEGITTSSTVAPTDDIGALVSGALRRVDESIIATGKQPVALLASAGIPPVPTGSLSPCTMDQDAFDSGTNDIPGRPCSFSASTDNYLNWWVPVPKGVDESVDLTARIEWSSTTTTDGTDDVIWGFACVAFSNDDAIDGNAFPADDTVTDTQTAAGDFLQSSEITAIAPAGTWAEHDTLVCRLHRDADNASDNFGGAALVWNVMLYFTTNANTDQ